MPRVIRKLYWFRRDTDEMVGSEPLRGVNLRDLRRIFDNPADDPKLHLSYEVTDRQRDFLQRHVAHHIRTDRYAYFVESETPAAVATVPSRRKAG